MTIDGIGNSKALESLVRVSGSRVNNFSETYSNIKFQSSGRQNSARFNELIKESPLADTIPNDKSLAKLGFKKSSMISRTYGARYEDGKGNTIYIGSWAADAESGVKGALRVRYESKDGLIQNVYFDPDKNPVKGTLEKKPTRPGDPTESFKYDYDIEGRPVITDQHIQYPYPDNI